MFFRMLGLLTLCLLSPLVIADAQDHPLLSRYPGAEIKSQLYTEYEKVSLPTGPADAEGNLSGEALVGNLSRITYEIEGVSTFKVFENYRKALKIVGAKLLTVCELDQCGGKNTGLLDLASAVAGDSYVGNYYRKPYFIHAKLDSAKGLVNLSLFIGGFEGDVWLHQVVVEDVPLENGLVAVAEDYLEKKPAATTLGDRRTAEEKQQDHPMIARYPETRLLRSRNVEYEKMTIAIGVLNSEGETSKKLDLVGDIRQYSYEAKNVSTLKIYRNYLEAIKMLGFSLEYTCELDECGDESASLALAESLAVDRDVENYYRAPYYLVASRGTGHGRIVIAVYFGGFEGDVWIQQAVVEERGAETDLVRVDSDQLYQEIQQSGKALVYGIYFDTDSTTVKPESADALKTISDLLESHPELELYVVGHTDDTGEGSYNLSLSSRRAASVVKALEMDYPVTGNRLEPAGVGPYAPVAGNESAEGRRLNRRVELVRRLSNED
ncbi:Outer membrane protein OmpA [Marinobacter daqiaonensis]|uniref:Outer membrane protein OmpA n=2 Tax=Marinobacter daqiaonensis TaxID=650891 RepID=A0A1I6I8S8_9GAMM|nr:Outer membrane protein OmpA [Marinobacter daqiaonensis]